MEVPKRLSSDDEQWYEEHVVNHHDQAVKDLADQVHDQRSHIDMAIVNGLLGCLPQETKNANENQ
jgi:hypothetical protein